MYTFSTPWVVQNHYKVHSTQSAPYSPSLGCPVLCQTQSPTVNFLLFCWCLFTSTHTRTWLETPDRWLCHFTFLKMARTFLGPWCKTWMTWVFWCVFVKCIVINFLKVWILILTHCQGQRCRATHTPNVGYKQYVHSGAGWLLFSGFVCS